MERKLLFINHRPEIIKEFAFAMEQQEFSVETASNGYDAAILLKKQDFQVVIFGMVLDGYNGNQILTYLNKCKPKTVCIVYTTVLTPGELKFLINERSVFRICLRTMDYYTEFPKVIEDAFFEYALKEKEKEEKNDLREMYGQKRKNLIEMGETIKRQQSGLSQAMVYLDYLLEKSLVEKRKILNEKDYQELYKAEKDLIHQYEMNRVIHFRNLNNLEEHLQKEFAAPGRKITFEIEENLSKLLPETLLRRVKITLWIILRRYLLLTKDFNARFYFHTDKEKIILEINMGLPAGVFQERSKITAEAVRNNIVKCIIESIGEKFALTEKEDCVKYYIEIKRQNN